MRDFWNTVFWSAPGEGNSPPEPDAPSPESPPMEMDFLGEGFDPPGTQDRPGEGGDPEPADGPQPVGEDTVVAGAGDPPPQPTPAPEPEPRREVDPEVAQLRARLAELEGKIEPKKEAPPQDPDQEFILKSYGGIRIPPDVLVALRDDDPAKASEALTGLMFGVLSRAARDSRAFVREELARMREEVPRIATNEVETRTRAQQVEADFYGNYPVLNKPRLRPVVAQTMQEIAQDWISQGKRVDWTPEFRDQLARRVAEDLGIQLQAKPNGGTRPEPRKQFASGSGSRPPASSRTDDPFDFLQE